MSTSIVILKTGEQIISELKEVFDGEGEEKKGICLLMQHPYTLQLIQVDNTEQDLQVKFSKWCPYSIDTQFKIPYDAVTAIGVPDSGLERAYLAKVEQVEEVLNQNTKLQQEEIESVINPEVV